MAEAIDNLFVRLGLETDAQQFEQAEAQFSSLQSTVLQFGAVIGGGIGLQELTFGFAEATEEANQFAQVFEGLGVTPQLVNQMRGAFELIRSDASQAIPFLENIASLIQDTEWGNFSEMALAEGFDISALQGADTAVEAMTALNEQLNQIDDPERARRIAEHLGFSQDQFRLLRNNDIGQLRQEAEAFSPLTQEMSDAAREFTQGWNELEQAMTGLKNMISVSFVGDLGQGMQDLAEAIKENREQIKSFADSAMPALNSIAVGIGTLVAARVGGGILGALRRSKIPGVPLLAAGATFIAQTGGGVEEQREQLAPGEGRSAVRDQMDRQELINRMPESVRDQGMQAQREWMQEMRNLGALNQAIRNNNFNYQISIDARGATNPEEVRRAGEEGARRVLEESADNAREDTASEAQ